MFATLQTKNGLEAAVFTLKTSQSREKHQPSEKTFDAPPKKHFEPQDNLLRSGELRTASESHYSQRAKLPTNNYNLRYNVVDGTAEICDRVGGKELFRPIPPVRLNTIVLQLHKKGIPAWDRDVTRILQSFTLKQYHPLNDFLTHLPTCDGTDRLTPLAKRISDDALWIRVFCCRMRGMVIQ